MRTPEQTENRVMCLVWGIFWIQDKETNLGKVLSAFILGKKNDPELPVQSVKSMLFIFLVIRSFS